MILNGGGVDIAVQGSGNALDNYWVPDDTYPGHLEVVASSGSAFSAPAMVLNGSGVDMTAAGPNGSLYDYYWSQNPGTSWSAGMVAPAGSVG
jgi:hypothetical protein